MGKLKPHENPGQDEPGTRGKMARGIAAYQDILHKKNNPPDAPGPENVGTRKTAGDGKNGLVKTGGKREAETAGGLNRKAGLAKTARPAAGPADQEISKYRRTAQFLVLIGSDKAAQILSRLDPEQIEAVSREIVSLRNISPEEGKAVLGEFRSLLSTPGVSSPSSTGGLKRPGGSSTPPSVRKKGKP
jgi:flagellar motor switch protein FliG